MRWQFHKIRSKPLGTLEGESFCLVECEMSLYCIVLPVLIITCFPSVCVLVAVAVFALEVREIATKDMQCGLLSGMLR